MDEHTPEGAGTRSIFGGGSDGGKKADEILSGTKSGEGVLFGDKDEVVDVEASEVLDEKVEDKNEVVVFGEKRKEDPDIEVTNAEVLLRTDFVIEKLKIVSKKKTEVSDEEYKKAKKELRDDGVDINKYILKGIDDISGINDENTKKKRGIEVGKRKRKLGGLAVGLEKGEITANQVRILEDMELQLNDFDKELIIVEEEEVDPPPTDRPDDPVRPEAGRNKETVGDYVKENEVSLNKYLLQEWNPLLSLHPDKPKLARLVELSKSIHKDRLMDRFRAGDTTVYEEMFPIAQDVYLKEILNDGNFIKIAGNSESIKRQEELSGFVNQDLRNRFEGKLMEFVERIFHDEKRRWFEYGAEGEMMKENLEKFLINKFNQPEKIADKTEYETVVKTLKSVYLQGDEIRGSQDVALSKEPRVELVKQMIKIHDLCVEMDAATFKSVENIKSELLQKIDDALIAMLSLKNQRGVSIVAKVIETYDSVMRREYETDGNEINIDDKTVEDKVKARLASVFGSEEEMKLFMRMGKDVCKITGIDAQYGYPYDIQPGDKRGLTPSVRGAFLRGIFNFNKALVTYNKANDTNITQLNSGIKLGAVAFWNKQRKDEPEEKMVESAPLTEGKITEIVNTKLVGNANFEGWIGTMKGFAEAKKEESDFMSNSPTLNTFVEKVVPAYLGYLRYASDKGRGYLQDRLECCLGYFLSQRAGADVVRASINKVFLADNIFDGKGIFESVEEMKEYFDSRGVVISLKDQKVKARNETARDAGARGDWFGVLKAAIGLKKR